MNLKVGKLKKFSSILFATTMIANACNYLFQFFMGRALSSEEFGTLNALLSLFVVSSVPGSLIQLTTTKYVSEFKTLGMTEKINEFILVILRISVTIAILIVVIGLFSKDIILSYLNIGQTSSYYILLLAIAVMIVMSVYLGILQGSQEFYRLGIVSIIQSSSKLILGCLFILAGFGLLGAIGSVLLSGIVIIIIFICKNKKNFTIGKKSKNHTLNIIEIIKYMGFSFVIILVISVITNIDMILVKHYFSAYDAGIYAITTVIGKIILYFPSAIIQVMVPVITESNALNKDTDKILLKGVKYTFLICALISLVIAVNSRFFVTILFGDKYINSSILIKYQALMIISLALINLIVNYCLSKKFFSVSYILILGCCFQIFLVSKYHSDIKQVMIILFAVNTIVVVSSLFYSLFKNRTEKV